MTRFVLAVETSCDDTALALLDFEKENVLAELVSSQDLIHADYDGIVPELAARAHLRNLPVLMSRILVEAGVGPEEVGLVAATRGPGLKGSLLIGYTFARAWAQARRVPFQAVNHLEGHLVSALFDQGLRRFPALALIVSGGHTEIVEMEALGAYRELSSTIDDAAGEAFDKSATLLGFDYPGGARLAALADTLTDSRLSLPKVMANRDEISFSGLKTAIARLVSVHLMSEPQGDSIHAPGGFLRSDVRAQIAHAAQRAIVATLMEKIERFWSRRSYEALYVAGGVAANRHLRACIENRGWPAVFPLHHHCTDNAAMIGLAAILKLKSQYGMSLAGLDEKERTDLSWSQSPDEVVSRWPLDS